jgi:proteasome lid subunit RPN8/RPN11
VFELARAFYEEIIDHAREEAPNECCGILAGRDGKVLRLYRAVNSEHSPYRYEIDPQDLFRIHSEVEARGWEFVAIYHSHPSSAAYPSYTDIALAQTTGPGEHVDLWPGVVYFIVSLSDPAAPQMKAFHIQENRVQEQDFSILN